MFNLFKKIITVDNNKGLFGYYKLYDWYDKEFSEKEKQRFKDSIIVSMGFIYSDFVEGKRDNGIHGKSAIWLLDSIYHNMLGKKGMNDIIEKFRLKAHELITSNPDFLDLHFLYATDVKYYSGLMQNAPEYENKFIESCNNQLNIAPQARLAFLKEYPNSKLPNHGGYFKLLWHLKKKGMNSEADKLERDFNDIWK